ncbi:MAG: fused MFS/spermidine synthase [Candidatus Riflebacteria bacterium]|nr:fused MFS/spermidine synthase [Candidatus Riflebacteria bacterium]
MLIYLIFLFSGLAGLIYEVVWFRELHLVFGVSYYSVAAVLTAYMLGLALGARFFGKKTESIQEPLKLYGALEISIGLFAMFMPFFFNLVGQIQSPVYEYLLNSPFLKIGIRFLGALLCLFPPTFMMGGTLPLLIKHMTGTKKLSNIQISTLYFVNTLGAALGAGFAGFWLVRNMGLAASSSLAACINVSIGILAILISGKITQPISSSESLSPQQSLSLPPQLTNQEPNKPFQTSNQPSDVNEMAQSTQQSSPFAEEPISPQTQTTHLPPQKVSQQSLNSIDLLLGAKLESLLLFTACACGFTAMGLEVCWTRVIAITIGATIYCFSAVLTAFLLGIAFGSLFSALRDPSQKKKITEIGFFLLITSASVILIIPILGNSALVFYYLRQALNVSFEAFNAIQFICLISLMIVPAFGFGALFPMLSRALAVSGKPAFETGRVFWWNTLGTVAGTLTSGFILIPFIGVRNTMFLLASILGFLSFFLLFFNRRTTYFCASSALIYVLCTLTFSAFFPWDKNLVTSGVFRYWKQKNTDNLYRRDRKLLFYREDGASIVSVEQAGAELSLRINGKPDASTARLDMYTQQLLSWLATALAGNPKKVLIIGLGSGITAGACLEMPGIEKVDILEINPAVIESSRLFKDWNGTFWENPKARIIEEDARNYVSFTKEKYDLILAEPTNIWLSGISGLFTLEAFTNYKKILSEGGVFAHFIHTYEISPSIYSSVLYTFKKVFPNCSLWMSSGFDHFLIGRVNEKSLDFENTSSLFKDQTISKKLLQLGIDRPFILASLFIASCKDFGKVAPPEAVNIDDFPNMEYEGPEALYYSSSIQMDPSELNFSPQTGLVLKLFPKENLKSDDWIALGNLWQYFGYDSIAAGAFKMAIGKANPDPEIICRLAGIYRKSGLYDSAYGLLKTVANISQKESDFISLVKCGLKYDSRECDIFGKLWGRTDQAFDSWKQSFPNDYTPWLEEALTFTKLDPQKAWESALKAEKMIDSSSLSSHALKKREIALLKGEILLKQEKFEDAEKYFRDVAGNNDDELALVGRARLQALKNNFGND